MVQNDWIRLFWLGHMQWVLYRVWVGRARSPAFGCYTRNSSSFSDITFEKDVRRSVCVVEWGSSIRRVLWCVIWLSELHHQSARLSDGIGEGAYWRFLQFWRFRCRRIWILRARWIRRFELDHSGEISCILRTAQQIENRQWLSLSCARVIFQLFPAKRRHNGHPIESQTV